MQALCQRLSDAGDRLQIGKAGVLDAFPTAKMAEEGLHFLCTEALNGFQRVLHRASSTTFAMEAVDEAVRFVSRMDQHAAVSVEDDGVVPLAKHGFLAFCQRSYLKAAPHLSLIHISEPTRLV